MTNPTPSRCPKCGAPIPAGAPQGLCPRCVLLAAATQPQSASPAAQTPPPSVTEIAAHFPELELIERIGAGGMGAVYKARQPKLDRLVALKILSRDLAGDAAFAERFDREARVLARLSHPNIVTVHDSGVAGPFAYLLMEYVDGMNLRQAMQAGRFTPAEALTLVQDLCVALKFAHERGILHRDIKPENILIDAQGRVKIADFGIAKLVGEKDAANVTLTQHGAVLGSPHYMAPEQIETPGDVDQRADLYSLGVVFYELLTGELPLGRFAPPSAKSPMDARIDAIVLRTLEKERNARYQSASDIRTGIAALANAPPPPAPAASDSARYALVSPLLTAFSFVPGIPLTILLAYSKASLAVMGSVFVALPAIAGLFLGAQALGEIRAAGGRRRGFLGAMFGTLAWPVLLILGATLFILVMPAVTLRHPGDTGGPGISLGVMCSLVVMAGGFSVIALVCKVGRVVSGRVLPWKVPSLAVTLVALLLGGLVLRQHFRAETSRPESGREVLESRPLPAASSGAVRPQLHRNRESVVSLAPGLAMTARLLRSIEDGPAEPLTPGETFTASGGGEKPLTLQLQTRSQGGGTPVFHVALTESGRNGRVLNVSFLADWSAAGDFPRELPITEAGQRRLRLATRGAEGWAETLWLELDTVVRPELEVEKSGQP